MTKRVVTLGAGQAAIAFAAKVRELDKNCQIIMIGDEPSLPYQRPPLSKKYMTGELDADRLLLRPEEWYEENQIQCRTNTTVSAINTATKSLTIDGQQLAFDKLLIATGATPRTLPKEIGGQLDGVYTLRDLADADAIGAKMGEGKNAVIIGGGYIGLEAASVFNQKGQTGMNVTVIEMADRILKRVASDKTASIIGQIHQKHGVKILQDTSLASLEGQNGHVNKAVLADGTELQADIVIVGIGVLPNDSLARDAGLVCNNGIEVDAMTKTSHPDIHAAGDVASFIFGEHQIRLESVGNAIEQGEHAAKVIYGHDEPYAPIPWFWSDQYDMKLQIAGLNMGFDHTVERSGNREGSKSIWYFSKDKFIAVDAVSDPKSYMFGKKLLEMGRSITPEQAGDETFDLRALIKP